MKPIFKRILKISENSCLSIEEKQNVKNFIYDLSRKQEVLEREKILVTNEDEDEDEYYYLDFITHQYKSYS